ncbi:50S ribosomal protein L9 [Desulfatiglans anilini]|uniref:50S ribosomal protein L9 n=1 Tax=Desulfatiglans anilini TaxID=90728 RepID=UPI0003FCB1B2|nr:50S ribosomal protein L9 [Desulfatiglans anilini]
MKVILRQDLEELGLEGDVVDVAKGYVRNYLVPRGIAVLATSQNIKAFELQKKKIELRRLRAKEEAVQLKERLEGMGFSFAQKAGEEGKLYGSVTAMDIAEELEKKGFVVDRRKILLDKPIKSVGDYKVPVRIYPGVTGMLQLSVVPEEKTSAE